MGGGGAGGLLTGTVTVGPGNYNVTVGDGGAGGIAPAYSSGTNGTDSTISFPTQVIADGGGKGATSSGAGTTPGGSGGSGGGGGGYNGGGGVGGTGTSGPPRQGYNGGQGVMVLVELCIKEEGVVVRVQLDRVTQILLVFHLV